MQPRGQRSSARLVSGAPGASAVGNSVQQARPADTERAAARAAARVAATRRARAAARTAEVEDSPRVLRDKCRRLARAIRNARHLVVYTGAGISTAADIPDYRGPRGVWTRLRRGEDVPRVEVSRAQPTLTHMALTALWARGALKFVVSQNCDGLHLRAGLPRRALAELHGNMYCELCAVCRPHRVYLRAFDTTERTARHAHGTRRLCHACGAELHDSIVHFGERGRAAWPLNWAGALRHAAAADVILCLGSSLKVLRRYPRLWCMSRPPAARPRLYIVNLQWTPKDAVAALKINARCDQVMAAVARRLRLRVPRYSPRHDPLPAHATPLAPPERHTVRRPALPPAPLAHAARSSDDESLSSPSASDSEEERPLTQLARRLRLARDLPPPLRAFQVSLAGGDATLLLRAEHAPIGEPHPAPPPLSSSVDKKPLSDLRKFRMWRRTDDMTKNGEVNGIANGKVKVEVDKKEEMKPFGDINGVEGVKAEGAGGLRALRRLLQWEPLPALPLEPQTKEEAWSSDESEGRASPATRARRIFRRAVLLCRHQLYPGLHTILCRSEPAPTPRPPPPPPPPPPLPPPSCTWCWAVRGARRCLWYEARDPLCGRVWRRMGRRRYLCACCGDEPDDEPEPELELAPDAPGWFGKGYRKVRRRR